MIFKTDLTIKKELLKKYKLKILSKNTFPTAAGCASSASSMSCLVKLLEKIYTYKEKYEGDLTNLARYNLFLNRKGSSQDRHAEVCLEE